MEFFKESITVVKSKVAKMVRFNERPNLEDNLDKVIAFIKDINRAENMVQDFQAAVKSRSGTILSVKELAELELPLIFKPLMLARSVRLASNHLPEHPDLKDYKDLGGGIEIIDAEVGDIKEICDEILATLNRNRIPAETFKVGDVWINKTLLDVFNNCTLKTSNAKDAKRFVSLVDNSISSVPVPLAGISSLVSVFNFTTTSDQWGKLFKEVYKI